jgi:hypothetical protein
VISHLYFPHALSLISPEHLLEIHGSQGKMRSVTRIYHGLRVKLAEQQTEALPKRNRVLTRQVSTRPAASKQGIAREQMPTNRRAVAAERVTGLWNQPNRDARLRQIPAIPLADPIRRATGHAFSIQIE